MRSCTYHNTDVPYIGGIAPFHLKKHLRSFVDFRLNVSSMNPTNPALAKIAQDGFTPESAFWKAKFTRSVYRAVSVNNLPGRRLVLFGLLEGCEDGLIVDGKHDVSCFDVCMRNEPRTCCVEKRNEFSNIPV